MSTNKLTPRKVKTYSNIVKQESLREVQRQTLDVLKETLIPSAGPYGSTTQILKGNETSFQHTEYSKDGHTILSHIKFNRVIEDSLQRELTEMTRYVVKEVGDGTTSVVILSSLIFNKLMDDKVLNNYPPYLIIDRFKAMVDKIKKNIYSHGRALKLSDVYDIAMICTNSNTKVASTLSDIYAEQGADVFIDVGISNTDHDVIKTYDGLTLETGYSDPVYINTKAESETDEKAGYSVIHNPHIYCFMDPIDTREMANFFNKIVLENIMKPYSMYMKTQQQQYLKNVVPTVILAPKITVDMNESFGEIIQFMYQFNNNLSIKPPLLIITNIGKENFPTYSDIWRLLGAKPIKKYLDPEIQKEDIEAGKAPSLDTILDFYGTADLVKADAFKTSFVNPADMFAKDDDGDYILYKDGHREYSETYKGEINFLEQELKRAEQDNATLDIVGGIRRRLHSLKANMVDYLVGGIDVTDRDSVRALVEDAVKNLRSAAIKGVGYGTNFEGLRASSDVLIELDKESRGNRELDPIRDLDKLLVNIINDCYGSISDILYSSIYYSEEEINKAVEEFGIMSTKAHYVQFLLGQSIYEECPMNFVTKKFDKTVLCTIDQDPVILDVIAKILTIMFTTNQALTQTPSYNMYLDENDM